MKLNDRVIDKMMRLDGLACSQVPEAHLRRIRAGMARHRKIQLLIRWSSPACVFLGALCWLMTSIVMHPYTARDTRYMLFGGSWIKNIEYISLSVAFCVLMLGLGGLIVQAVRTLTLKWHMARLAAHLPDGQAIIREARRQQQVAKTKSSK